jgi:hypothetical protein
MRCTVLRGRGSDSSMNGNVIYVNLPLGRLVLNTEAPKAKRKRKVKPLHQFSLFTSATYGLLAFKRNFKKIKQNLVAPSN